MTRIPIACVLTVGLLGPAIAYPPGATPETSRAVTKAAQGSITMTRWTIDAGGTTNAAGGNFRLGATIGQPEAALLAGGSYQLSAGFWVPESGGDGLFANGFE